MAFKHHGICSKPLDCISDKKRTSILLHTPLASADNERGKHAALTAERKRWCARAITVVPTPDSWSREHRHHTKASGASSFYLSLELVLRRVKSDRPEDASGNISHTHTRRERCKIEFVVGVAMKIITRNGWKNAHALVCVTWCVRIHPLYFAARHRVICNSQVVYPYKVQALGVLQWNVCAANCARKVTLGAAKYLTG